MKLRSVVKGALTFVPGMSAILPKPNAGSHPPATYFYGVWMKHLAYLTAKGFPLPQSVAELGPGDCLGVGISALLSGANRYYGLDIVEHTKPESNVRELEQLADFFRQRAPRPTKGWPDFDPLLDERLFSKALTDEVVTPALAPERLAFIREALLSAKGEAGDITLTYRVPWSDASVIEEGSVDLVVSQAVLEHVKDIRATYAALYKWLRPGGVMSHQIDFRSHNLTPEWNGHRAISEPLWRVMLGNRPYLINREPWSAHAQAITDCGFRITCALLLPRTDGIPRSRLAKRWRNLSDEDFNCAEVFVQAQKPLH